MLSSQFTVFTQDMRKSNKTNCIEAKEKLSLWDFLMNNNRLYLLCLNCKLRLNLLY